MEAQHELAFRSLQGGMNTGKIVVRVAGRKATGANGTHVVTGGTSGLGLLTGRWLAQRGASALVLSSRSGLLGRNMDTEWEAVQTSSTLERPTTALLRERASMRECSRSARVWRCDSKSHTPPSHRSTGAAATAACAASPSSRSDALLAKAALTGARVWLRHS